MCTETLLLYNLRGRGGEAACVMMQGGLKLSGNAIVRFPNTCRLQSLPIAAPVGTSPSTGHAPGTAISLHRPPRVPSSSVSRQAGMSH